MRTTFTLKKGIAIFATALASAGISVSAGTQSLIQPFTEAGYWNTQNSSTYTVAGGRLNCTMANQGTSYRADLWYNFSSNAAADFSLNPTTDVYLAIKFIGDRPNGNLKFEMQWLNGTATAWMNSQWNVSPGDGNFTSTANNKIYYFRLTKDANYTGTAITIRRMHLVMADAKVAPYEYKVDWVATFTTLEEIEAFKDAQDDGALDADETTIDPATLSGYINQQFNAGAENWVKSYTDTKVVWNNGKLIFSNPTASSSMLQVKKTGMTINTGNFPYLALKMDKLPAGSSHFKIQTNCAALGIYDSWYSVVQQKGDVYVFDMTAAVNKNTSAVQNAISTENTADVWIDFGTVADNEMAQIEWIKSYQTLAEIPTESASPLVPETDTNAGGLAFEFSTDNLSTSSWEWKTVHWQGGENGVKVSSSNDQLVMEPNAQVGAQTSQSNYALNTTNYPYLAVKVDEMGDAAYFKFLISSLSKGGYEKSSVDATLVGTKMYVFDVSTMPTVSTATDVNVRMDFYQGTSGTINPTLPVKVDWVRSYKTMDEINALTTSVNDKLNTDLYAFAKENKVIVSGTLAGQTLTVFNAKGQQLKQVIATNDKTLINLNAGMYFIKVDAKVLKIVL